tara:strand:- start:1247 stop:2896 length:1650 start_codon:yes stop_codon:yes gene_type:complete
MSDKLNVFRQEYPDYTDTPNGQLAFGIWNRSYKDQMPMGLYADSIGLSNDDFKKMVSFSEQSEYKPTESTYAEGFVPRGARAATAGRGMSLGAAENIAAGVAAGGEKVKRLVTGEEQRPFGEAYEDYLGISRDIIGQYQKAKPVESFLMEAAPAIASGVGIERAIATGAPRIISAMSPAAKIPVGTSPSVVKTAAASGIGGAVYGFNTGETGERLESAYELAIPSALFGGGGQVFFNFAAPALRGIGRSFGRRMEQFDTRPTVETARQLKNDIYKRATDSGVVYDVPAMKSLYGSARRLVADSASYVPEVDDQMTAALKILKRNSRTPSNLIQLEKIRRAMYQRYQQSGYSDQTIRDLVDLVDDTIQNFGTGDGTIIKAARLANSKYKKAELIDSAFDKARRSAEAAGSGGNTVNRYKQVVNNILNSEKDMRFFDASEEEAMRQFVKFTPEEQITRGLAKLDPTSGGLMGYLGLGGYMADPVTTTLIAAPAAIARRGLEQRTGEAGESLVTRMATGTTPMTTPATLPSTATSQFVSGYERDMENIRGNR